MTAFDKQPRSIAIKGAYGWGNFGDDALMVAARETVRRVFPSIPLTLMCHDAGYIRRMAPEATVVSPNGTDGDVADLLVYGGGTQFYSFPRTRERDTLERIVWNMQRPVGLAYGTIRKLRRQLLCGKGPKLAAVGIGLGPFVDNSRELRRAERMFGKMEFLAVRDAGSYELCRKWGCANVALGSDLCYLPGLWPRLAPRCGVNTKNGRIGKVGIIVRDWPHTYDGDSYVLPLFQVVDQLRSEGRTVEFISFARGYDRQWAKRLEDNRENMIAWDAENDSIPSFLEVLEGYDAFITARYHGAVFASILGKPVVCIEIEQKLRLASDLLGDGARLWTFPFAASKCLAHLSDLQAGYSSSVECLARIVQEQGILAEETVRRFRECGGVN